ncbi:MAG: hypothetical protein KDC79_10475 [Cyclobacteriaceae bacterium]|nr:hypothetical protein [Cyclobacteriaceae bacterium]
MKRLLNILIALTLVVATSCTYTFPEAETPTSGSASFTKVVAVGNSLTAGFMNGALYTEGQENSYANIIATQMQTVGGGTFNQPDINSVNGYYGMAGSTILGRLHLVGIDNPAPSPIIPGEAITAYSGDKSSLNNFGVPGMRIIDAAYPGYGTANPYFGRFASNPATGTVLGDASAANGTFIILWLGSNDVLGYAIHGATGGTEGDGTSTTDMTAANLFTGAYQNAINTLFANGQKGIIANIPNVQDIPYFTTVSWNSIPMDQATANQTNQAYLSYNGGLDQAVLGGFITQDEADLRYVEFEEGNNGIVINDEELTDLSGLGLPSIRMTNSNDLITLTAGAVLGTLANPSDPTTVIGVGVPLDEEYTLTPANQEAIADRTAEFNAVIAAQASNDIAFLDINSIFKEFAQSGALINGAGLDATLYPPFGAFSLDGIHPNARGYAYIANLFIGKINESYGANIPEVNPNNYPGNELPVPQ